MLVEQHATSAFSEHMEVDAYPISLSEGYGWHSGAIGNNEITFLTYKDMDSPPYYRLKGLTQYCVGPYFSL